MTVTQNRQSSAQITWDEWILIFEINGLHSKVLLLLKMKLLRLKVAKSAKKKDAILLAVA